MTDLVEASKRVLPGTGTRWFFITGCQRSGTTMLRLVLECHSQIGCLDEMRSYAFLRVQQDQGTPISKPYLGLKIPRLAEQLDHDHPYDFGLPEAPPAFYRGEKVLFMVRDFRDAIASMIKLRGARSWLEDWAIPIIWHKAGQESAFAQRWKRELALCKSTQSLPAFGALYWAYKNEALGRYIQKRYAVLPISYETLVKHPRVELARICAFLGLEFEEALLEHPRHSHGELYENGMTVGNTDPKRAIDTSSVGNGQSWFSPSDERLVCDIALPIANQLISWLAGG